MELVSKKHTPTPWKIDDSGSQGIVNYKKKAVISLVNDGGCSDSDCCGGPLYDIKMSKEDAAFIIRACNNHEKMLTILEDCRDFLKKQADAEYLIQSPTPIPNEAMKLYVFADEAIKNAVGEYNEIDRALEAEGEKP